LNFLLIIAGAGLILAAGFILKGRKNQAARNARYRAPRPLKMDRTATGQGRAGERSPLLSKTRPSSSPAAPIMLGVVLLVLSLWLVAAYLRPATESAQAGTETDQPSSPPPPQPAQVGTLAGRLSAAPEPSVTTEQPPPASPKANQPPPAAPKTDPSPPTGGGARAAGLAQAAAAQAGSLSQVGLLPTNLQTPKSSPESTSRPAAATKAETKPGASAPAGPTAKADQTPPPALPASVNSNLVRALAEPPPGGTSTPAAPGGGRSGILSNTAGFTVHLGSFVDQANAEKFRAKLAAAGEDAAISEISLDGRRWYRVLSGRFDTRTAAEAHGRDLKRRGLTDDTGGPFIVKPINSSN
jgi:cell division protein FtsN